MILFITVISKQHEFMFIVNVKILPFKEYYLMFELYILFIFEHKSNNVSWHLNKYFEMEDIATQRFKQVTYNDTNTQNARRN